MRYNREERSPGPLPVHLLFRLYHNGVNLRRGHGATAVTRNSTRRWRHAERSDNRLDEPSTRGVAPPCQSPHTAAASRAEQLLSASPKKLDDVGALHDVDEKTLRVRRIER
jgi:hypothetical protein